MLGEPTAFWGKIRRDLPVCQWHPLFDHCADVAAVAEALMALPIWRERLNRSCGCQLTHVTLQRLATLAALHDVGKLNIGFQAKGRPELGPTAGHVEEALSALLRLDGPLASLHELGKWGNGATDLLVTSISHHGKPHNYMFAAKWQASWWRPRSGLDPSAGCKSLLDRCRVWFPGAFEAEEALPEATRLAHAFAGLVMLADWIASDTRFFPYSETSEDRMPFSREMAGQALARMGIDVSLVPRGDVARRSSFDRIAPHGYTPRRAQMAISRLPREAEGSITILEAETGSGKTEAALSRFIDLFEAGLVDGLYFALPTRTAATQIHRRVLAATIRAFPSPPPVLLAVPGYLRVDEVEGVRLAPFEVLWPDSEAFRWRGWAAENSKRYLAGCIVVGTVDQVLLSSLMVGHAHLRASALARHFLVVDEVHASDAYMERILRDVLARHHSSGGHALLLSATLGGEARRRLLRPGQPEEPVTYDDALATPYPLLTHRGPTTVDATPMSEDGRGKTVTIVTEAWQGLPRRIAERAAGAAVEGATVLVVRNTVTDCVATQREVEGVATGLGRRDLLFACGGVPAPHHARFSRPDRVALDEALEHALGRSRPSGGRIVVATQTVQQSLDIDADLLITDLCPVDILLQRLGRLHRHQRQRPDGFETPTVLVLAPDFPDLGTLIKPDGSSRSWHGLGTIYPDLRILDATLRLAEQHPYWRTPSMNRFLVESCTHSAALEQLYGDKGGRWRDHANFVTGAERGEARQAELNLIDWARPYSEMTFPRATDQRIATRLGEGDRMLRLDPPAMGPFGYLISDLVMPAWLARGLPPDVDSTSPSPIASGGFRCALGEELFVYDRLGLRPLDAPSSAALDV